MDILTGRKVDIQIWAIGQKVVVWLVGKLTCTHSSQSVYSTHSYKIFRQLQWDGTRVNLVSEGCGWSCGELGVTEHLCTDWVVNK